MSYTEKQFNIGKLGGISEKAIAEHLKLYAGYVKHTNLIMDKITELSADQASAEKNAYAIAEMQRRFSFEFDGMRNHEYYFEQFEGADGEAKTFALNAEGPLYKQIENDFGSFDSWLSRFKTIAMTRGIGWAILYFDKTNQKLVNSWIDEQHLGHLTGLEVVIALDMWEHSYLFDYVPAEKKNYIEAFFSNLNVGRIEDRLAGYTK